MPTRRPKLTPERRAERDTRRAAKEAEARAISAANRFDNDFILAGAEEAAREDQAPAAQRVVILGLTADIIRATPRGQKPEPAILRPALVTASPSGLSRINPLVAMLANGRGLTITREHFKAATRLKNDYDTGVEGARSPRAGIMRVDGGSDQDSEYPWLDAVTRYNAALEATGKTLRGIVHAIAVDWLRVPRIAQLIGVAETVTVGLIVAGLDRLVGHYDPGAAVVRLVAPPLPTPFAFDFAVSAIGEAVPAERLGMGRMPAAAQKGLAELPRVL